MFYQALRKQTAELFPSDIFKNYRDFLFRKKKLLSRPLFPPERDQGLHCTSIAQFLYHIRSLHFSFFFMIYQDVISFRGYSDFDYAINKLITVNIIYLQ